MPVHPPEPTPRGTLPRRFARSVIVVVLVLVAGAALSVSRPVASAVHAGGGGPLRVFAAYSTAVVEPWNSVIHQALTDMAGSGTITYRWVDEAGSGETQEAILRRAASEEQPHIIVGDAFGNPEGVRRVAAQ